MEYIQIENEFPHLPSGAVTLGKFDGIHRGHRRLVENVINWKEKGAAAVMFAFNVNEKTILSRTERRRMAEELGLDFLIECPLNEHIRHMKAERFVKEILAGDLHAVNVTVGEDFRFGFERKGTPELLTRLSDRLGFETDIIPFETDGTRKISSTYVREELRRGNMEKTMKLLGAPFRLDAVVEDGRGLGHIKLLPTLNLIPPEDKLMPPNGVYMTKTYIDGGVYPGITDVGFKPTVNGTFLAAETYLLRGGRDLYGLPCRTEFYHYRRKEKTFESLEALKSQLLLDAEAGEAFFADMIQH